MLYLILFSFLSSVHRTLSYYYPVMFLSYHIIFFYPIISCLSSKPFIQ